MEIDVERIKQYLEDGYEKDFLDACLGNLKDKGNQLRLSNFSYSLRELFREVLSYRAPDRLIRRCEWYSPDPMAKGGITRVHRIKYAIQGGLSDKMLDGEMIALIENTCNKVKKQNDRLNAFTHITKKVLYSNENIEIQAKKALDILLDLFNCIDISRRKFGLLATSKVMDKLYLEKVLTNSITTLKGIPSPHSFSGIAIMEVLIKEITDKMILFYTYGVLYYTTQIVNESERLIEIPYESNLVSKIPSSIETLSLKIKDFNVHTDKIKYY